MDFTVTLCDDRLLDPRKKHSNFTLPIIAMHKDQLTSDDNNDQEVKADNTEDSSAYVPSLSRDYKSACFIVLLHTLTSDNFISGACALSLAFAAMHPIDTFKCQLQASATNNNSCNSIAVKSILNWNTLRHLGRGFGASVVGAGPQGGARLATYELTRELFTSNTSIHPVVVTATAAVVGDFASSIVKVPREVITSRLQTSNAPGQMRVTDVVRDIIKQDGIPGLFRGFWSTTARDCPFMVILFASYESGKLYGPHEHLFKNPFIDTSWHAMTYGGLSGALAGWLTTPFDVVKTKIMTSKTSLPAHVLAKKLWRTMGLRVFFTGATARSAWWLGICGIFFPSYEFMKQLTRSLDAEHQ